MIRVVLNVDPQMVRAIIIRVVRTLPPWRVTFAKHDFIVEMKFSSTATLTASLGTRITFGILHVYAFTSVDDNICGRALIRIGAGAAAAVI